MAQTDIATSALQNKTGVGIDVLASLVNRAFDRAKRWAGAVLILQASLFAAGVVAIIRPSVTLSYPWIALPLALVGAELSRRVATLRGLAEDAKRQHEIFSAFGVKPSGGQLADLRQALRNELPAEVDELLKQGIAYTSDAQQGPQRALDNLIESAWFTKHLADRCAVWVGVTFVGTVTIAISFLLWLASTATGAPAGVASAKGIAATLIFLISVGCIRSWVGYSRLSRKAKEIDAEACRLLSASPSGFDAQRILTEYQVTRASAPLIPTWIWKLYRGSLNESWKLKKPCQ